MLQTYCSLPVMLGNYYCLSLPSVHDFSKFVTWIWKARCSRPFKKQNNTITPRILGVHRTRVRNSFWDFIEMPWSRTERTNDECAQSEWVSSMNECYSKKCQVTVSTTYWTVGLLESYMFHICCKKMIHVAALSRLPHTLLITTGNSRWVASPQVPNWLLSD